MKRGLVITCFSLLLLACQQEEKKPDYLWSEEQFVEVLTEIQIAESIVRLGYNRLPDSLYMNDSVYNAAFHSAGVTRVDFDSNMNYFLQRPAEFEKIYDQVIVRLSTRLAEQKAKQKEAPVDPEKSI